MCKVGMESNITDPLIKSLSLAKHERHIDAMGILYMKDYDMIELSTRYMIGSSSNERLLV
jgi:hypothetical protein